MLLDHLGEWPIRDAASVGEAASSTTHGRRRLVLENGPQLADEPGLADSGVAHDRDDVRLAALDGAPVGGEEELDLRLAADERLTQAADAPRAHQRQSADDSAADDAPSFPFASTFCGSSNSNAPRAAATVRSPARISPGAAACSSRAAR